MTRHGALAAFVALFLILAQVATAAAAPASQGSGGQRGAPAAIDKGLQKELKAGTATKILVEFDAKANLTAAKKVKERTKRGTAVLKALTDTAANSQKTAKATVARTKGVKATSYWLTNVLVVEGDAKTLDKLAKHWPRSAASRRSVRRRSIRSSSRSRPRPRSSPPPATPSGASTRSAPTQAWADGVLGQGIVVANVDTGVDFAHPALVEQYRGNNRRRHLHPRLQLVGPDRHLRRRAVRQRRPRHAHDGHDGRWRRPRPVHARHRRRARRPVDRGQGLRGLRLHREVAPVVRPVHPRPDRPQRREPRPVQAPRHRQQLVGRRARRHVLPRDRPGLAGRRHHPGLLVRQPRPVLRRGRLAGRLPRVLQRRRDRRRGR